MNSTTANQSNNVSAATNGAALKNIDKVADEAAKVTAGVPTEPPKIAPRVAHSLLVSSIVAAGGQFKAAINLEVAVCLTVYAQFRGVNLAAKKELYSVYKEAGYDCEVGGSGKDYKTVNRRIGYAGQFYASLPEGAVEGFMGDETRDAAALQSIVNHLTVQHNFRSMNDVLTAAGVTPPSRQRSQRAATAPAPAAGPAPSPSPTPAPEPVRITATDQKTIDAAKKRYEKGDAPTERQLVTLTKYGINLEATKPDAADKGVSAAMDEAARNRRETDSDKFVRLPFEGATLILPVDMKPEMLGELGIKLMQVSHQMKGDKLDAKMLAETFGVAVTSH